VRTGPALVELQREAKVLLPGPQLEPDAVLVAAGGPDGQVPVPAAEATEPHVTGERGGARSHDRQPASGRGRQCHQLVPARVVPPRVPAGGPVKPRAPADAHAI